MFNLTPLKDSHKLCNIICFSIALKHNIQSPNNHILVIRNIFNFTFKIIRNTVHCTCNIHNVTCLLRYKDNYVVLICL